MATLHPIRYRRMLEKLRGARIEADLTQAEVAKLIDVPQQFISRIETGERRIDPLELLELAQVYDKPLAFFLK